MVLFPTPRRQRANKPLLRPLLEPVKRIRSAHSRRNVVSSAVAENMRHLTSGRGDDFPVARLQRLHGRRSKPAIALPGSAPGATPDGTTANRTSAAANEMSQRSTRSSPAVDKRTFFRAEASDSPRAPLRPRPRRWLVVPEAAGGNDTLVPGGTADHLHSLDTAGWPPVATNAAPRHCTRCRNTGSGDRPERTPVHSPSADSAEHADDEDRGLALPVVD
jgi:hypothetical protein